MAKDPYDNDDVIEEEIIETVDETTQEDKKEETVTVIADSHIHEEIDPFDTEEVKQEEKQIEKTDPVITDVPETNVIIGAGRNGESSFKKGEIIDKDRTVGKFLFTLRGTHEEVMKSIEALPENFVDNEHKTKWARMVIDADEQFHLKDDQLFEATIRPGGMWMNMIQTPSNKGTERWVGPLVDRKGQNYNDKSDKRFSALEILKGSLGLGYPVYIPLYHTGIWVELTTPSAQDFAILHEKIENSKITYGRMTRGELFSNDGVILRKHVKDFILKHVVFTTAPNDSPEYLESIIKAPDLDILMAGIMLSRYPDSFPLGIPCTVDPNECTEVVEGNINLREIFWTDRNKLTNTQLAIANGQRYRITQQQLEQYQEEFNQENRIVYFSYNEAGKLEIFEDDEIPANGVKITLRTPTLANEEDYGVAWVNDVQRSAERVFKERTDEKSREDIIRERVVMNYFKTYGQFIESIEVIKASNIEYKFSDTKDIDEVLTFMSSDYVLVDYFRKAVRKYINQNIVQIIGVPNFECPNCGKKHNTAPGAHHLILPLDTLNTFFLLVQSAMIQAIQDPRM